MLSLTLHFRRAAITVCGATLIAACDTDRAVSPVSASKAGDLPTTVAAGVLPTPSPYLATETVDQNGALVGGAVLLVKDSTNTPIMLVADNGPLDVIKQAGALSFKLPSAGTFTVCEGNAPTGYGYAPNQPPCRQLTVKYGTTTHFTGFLLYPAPSVVFAVEDWSSKLIGPSTFTVAAQRSLVKITVTDNAQNDLLASKLGVFLVKLPKAGVYTVCETVAPVGFYKADPPCVTVDASSGGSVYAQTFFNPEAQIFYP
jgi:hypothetical protein